MSLALPKLAAAFEKAAWKKRRPQGRLAEGHEGIAGRRRSSSPASPSRRNVRCFFCTGRSRTRRRHTVRSPARRFSSASRPRMAIGSSRSTISASAGRPNRTRGCCSKACRSRRRRSTSWRIRAAAWSSAILSNARRASELCARRFKLGRAVLVASPNEGTPLATPRRWDETVGWIANLLEMLPDNPFTTGAAFVANGLVWLANHASGDLPGLHSMDGDGELIAAIQMPPGPPLDAYSALVANYHPTGETLRRLLDAGHRSIFRDGANDLVVPSEGGWRVDRSITGISASRHRLLRTGRQPGGRLRHAYELLLRTGRGGLPRQCAAWASRSRSAALTCERAYPIAACCVARPIPPRPQRGLRGGARSRSRAAVSRKEPAAPAPLRITVTNGDLTFEREVLLLGHYRSTRLTGTEAVMDRLIGGAMSQRASIGRLPVVGRLAPDFHQQPPQPRARHVHAAPEGGGRRRTGRGRQASGAESGQHRPSGGHRVGAAAGRGQETSKRATSLWRPRSSAAAATGVTAGEAARLIAQGVSEANVDSQDAEHAGDGTWPRVSHLHFIELYLDRAPTPGGRLRMQEASKPGQYDIDDRVMVGTGPLQRPPDSGLSRHELRLHHDRNEGRRKAASRKSRSRSTRGARAARCEDSARKARSFATSSRLRRAIRTTIGDLGRTLFNLLVPIELEAYLAGSGEMVIELDSGTARIPWELLDRDASAPPPWALRVKLLRKLRTARYRDARDRRRRR